MSNNAAERTLRCVALGRNHWTFVGSDERGRRAAGMYALFGTAKLNYVVRGEMQRQAFATFLAPLRDSEWVVYSKRPFGGPKEVLRYLARYTHRVAISNRRLIACDDKGVTFKWKDYRLEGRERYKVMTLATDEFIRRFLIHVLPAGFHRIRYYGLLASGKRAGNVARARELLTLPVLPVDAIEAANTTADEAQPAKHACPCCGGRMIIIERFERGSTPHYHPSPPTPVIRIDTS